MQRPGGGCGVTAADAAPSAVRRGILVFLAAIAAAAAMDVFVKLLAADYPTGQILFFRSAVGLVPVLVAVAPRTGLGALLPRRPAAAVGRGLLQAVAAFLFFHSFRTLPLADAYAIGFTAPLLVSILAGPVLGERIGRHRWIAVGTGFAGVLVMLQPGAQGGPAGWVGPASALGGAFFYALAAVLIRRLGRSEGTAALTFTTNVVMTLASLVLLPFGWETPDLPDLGLFVAMGLLAGVMTLLFVEAFRTAPASAIVPFEYTAMVWAVLFGFLVWGDVPTPALLSGAAVVVASGLWLWRRESSARAG
jgi:drug/metabolite transporter (DMT)-like permease